MKTDRDSRSSIKLESEKLKLEFLSLESWMNFCLEHEKESLTSLFKWKKSEWTLIFCVLYFKMVGRDSEVQLCFQTSSNTSPAAQRHKGSRTGGSVVCCSAAIKHWREVLWGKKKKMEGGQTEKKTNQIPALDSSFKSAAEFSDLNDKQTSKPVLHKPTLQNAMRPWEDGQKPRARDASTSQHLLA